MFVSFSPLSRFSIYLVFVLASSFNLSNTVQAEPPHVSYIFPAGGQRGTIVDFKVGGHYMHEAASFFMQGEGINACEQIQLTDTLWFESPLLPKAEAKKAEDYPRDYAGQLKISRDAPTGIAEWRIWNSQGVTPALKFVVGDLPEITEQEIEGEAIPEKVSLPLTINGRIFPREDVDLWTFEAQTGETITCEVLASRLGSPLDSRLELRSPTGKRVAENDDAFGTDSQLRFVAQESGEYQLSICDTDLGGLQHYVYRLTITKGAAIDHIYPLGGQAGDTVNFQLTGTSRPPKYVNMVLPPQPSEKYPLRIDTDANHSQSIPVDVDTLPEILEQPATPSTKEQAHTAPVILNGRISQAGEQDEWFFQARADVAYELDLYASRLGSPLDSVLTIHDSSGSEIAKADDIKAGVTDSQLNWKAPVEGVYSLRINDRLTSRGGEEYAYRLKIRERHESPGFSLTLSNEHLNIDRGTDKSINITANRTGGFTGPVELSIPDLPEGITLENQTIAAEKNNTSLKLIIASDARVALHQFQIAGTAEVNGKIQQLTVSLPVEYGDKTANSFQLAVTMPTPFSFKTAYEQKFIPRGSVYLKRYEIVRNGFEGSITVSLADRQVRHKQGVTGPEIIVPAGESSVAYPLLLSPQMEVGRVGRINLMAVGEVTDNFGERHQVTYTSMQESDQLIPLIYAEKMVVRTDIKSFKAVPGDTISIPVRVERGFQLEGPVTVSLIVPRHMKGLQTKELLFSAEQKEGMLEVQFSKESIGPFNMPLKIKAEMVDEHGHPIIHYADVTFVAAKK